MERAFPRQTRVGEQVRRELASILVDSVKDPRVGMVTIADVEVSRDYGFATVYFTTLGDDERIKDATEGLQSASGYLRRLLSKRLSMRTTPQLRFVYDDTQAKGARISSLIAEGLRHDGADDLDDEPETHPESD